MTALAEISFDHLLHYQVPHQSMELALRPEASTVERQLSHLAPPLAAAAGSGQVDLPLFVSIPSLPSFSGLDVLSTSTWIAEEESAANCCRWLATSLGPSSDGASEAYSMDSSFSTSYRITLSAVFVITASSILTSAFLLVALHRRDAPSDMSHTQVPREESSTSPNISDVTVAVAAVA